MEERLDKIANSEENISEDERLSYLDEFFAGENGLRAKIQQIDDMVDADEARRAHLPSLEMDFASSTSEDSEIGLFVGPWALT